MKPKPWKVEPDHAQANLFRLWDEHGNYIAESMTVDGMDKAARLMEAAPDLVRVLEDLRKELRAHIKLNVRKHFSLMTADAAAGTVLHKIKGAA